MKIHVGIKDPPLSLNVICLALDGYFTETSIDLRPQKNIYLGNPRFFNIRSTSKQSTAS